MNTILARGDLTKIEQKGIITSVDLDTKNLLRYLSISTSLTNSSLLVRAISRVADSLHLLEDEIVSKANEEFVGSYFLAEVERPTYTEIVEHCHYYYVFTLLIFCNLI